MYNEINIYVIFCIGLSVVLSGLDRVPREPIARAVIPIA